MLLKSACILSGLSSLALAHGAPKTPEEIAQHNALQASVYHCAPQIKAYNAERRKTWATRMLGADALADKNLFIDSSFDDLNPNEQSGVSTKLLACDAVEEQKIRNNTCVLAPIVTQGPYYHSWGHPIRQNMAEWQLGVLFLMDIGVIDVETCEPLPNVLVDLWHANATGYYAGHPKPAPGLENQEPQRGGTRSGLLSAYPRENEEETWLRGAWPTDKNGVAQFTSVFPGYYTGRATHVHVKVHTEWETQSNGSFTPTNTIYVGQLYFEDDLNMEVDKIFPYSTNPIANKWGRTRNWRDSMDIFDHSNAGGFKATFDVHPLNGVLQQGVIGYMTMGLNKSMMHLPNGWNPDVSRGGYQAPVFDQSGSGAV